MDSYFEANKQGRCTESFTILICYHTVKQKVELDFLQPNYTGNRNGFISFAILAKICFVWSEKKRTFALSK